MELGNKVQVAHERFLLEAFSPIEHMEMKSNANFYVSENSCATDIKSIKAMIERLEKRLEIESNLITIAVPPNNFNIVIFGDNTNDSTALLLGLKPKRSTTFIATSQ